MVYSNYEDILNNAACFVCSDNEGEVESPKAAGILEDMMDSEFGGGRWEEEGEEAGGKQQREEEERENN